MLTLYTFSTSEMSNSNAGGTETFLKKITSVREKLRVLEQKINNHPRLSDVERAEMQMLITRAYGSLTTFNILFRDEEDRFEGIKSAD